MRFVYDVKQSIMPAASWIVGRILNKERFISTRWQLFSLISSFVINTKRIIVVFIIIILILIITMKVSIWSIMIAIVIIGGRDRTRVTTNKAITKIITHIFIVIVIILSFFSSLLILWRSILYTVEVLHFFDMFSQKENFTFQRLDLVFYTCYILGNVVIFTRFGAILE